VKENAYRYIEVKEKLLAELKVLAPHDRLPSRTALAEKYGAARTTVERAISELIGEGLLYSRDGSGTYVAESLPPNPKVGRQAFISLGLVIPDIRHDTYPGILRGVEDVTDRSGINLIVGNTDNRVEKQANYLDKLIDSGVSGVIIVPAIAGGTDLSPFHKLSERGIPVVFCNRGVEGFDAPRVISNNFYGAYIAVKHLIQRGCRSIAYISNPLYSTSYERVQGYTSALIEAGIDVDEQMIVFEPTFDSDRPGYRGIDKLLRNNRRPDGVFCFNDAIAEGVYAALAEYGMSVGQDVLVIGYDDTSICERLPVKLSSVKFQTYEIGTQAAELLIRMLQGEKVPNNKLVVLQPQLVERESTGVLVRR
jgi:DNA-binding LacI/PurR family transcriptional regulator